MRFSYKTKMCLRLMLPCVIILIFGFIMTALTCYYTALAAREGGFVLNSDLPFVVGSLALVSTALSIVIQAKRLRAGSGR